MRMLLLLVVLAAEGYLTPQRAWLDRLALVVPSSGVTRWLLVADLACLVAMGRATPRPWLGISLAVAFGFLVVTGLGMALTDFYLGLAMFHLAVGIVALMFAGRARWLGALTLGLAIVLGVLT
jgi:hypothetical protein